METITFNNTSYSYYPVSYLPMSKAEFNAYFRFALENKGITKIVAFDNQVHGFMMSNTLYMNSNETNDIKLNILKCIAK
ncbi:hypothetical protein A3K86_14545 [Photobacterium jeanii]|uniref:Uncharacterized protein n=1 Tax=Photobacterium jeanii TaxID=858640 RepID=A0A178K9I4_9GAMM|nr:hypothetical protein [Photobacterium jeanii]OAN13777.1 hypothetical protein A3K86_14545 [Photobacterium jeanii]PST92763.1 hypothetical protein C9I91_06255 [Photobacterium jeanii]